MSRIGKMPIEVPKAVKVQIDGRKVVVEGPRGKLDFTVPDRASVELQEDRLVVARRNDEAESRAMHGLSRAILNNMVQGVSAGFVRKLEIEGVGFKAAVSGRQITLNLGFSHPIHYPIPEQVEVAVEDQTKLTISGPDKQKVGQVAAEIRGYYPAEPYKGKGVKYEGERIVRKEGKKAQ